MRKTLLGVCVAAGLTASVLAQDKTMPMSQKDHMAMEKSYSGCIERGEANSYVLTHAVAVEAKSKDKKPAMKGDATMKGDAMMKDDAMMMTAPLHLASASADFAKHAGHKVTITGSAGDEMNGVATFKVTSLKMIAGSCTSAEVAR
ncbi:MAG TPA: hypothetical protein VFV98_19710 [Vicinamibacterales bacterium]|nr:hypothetical protein [Vicinamibacterales bacterium]